MSTRDKDQDTENQLHQLQAFAEQHSTVYRVYTSQELGGKSERSEYKRLLFEAYRKKLVHV